MQRELSILTKEPPPGISCWAVDDQIDKLEAGLFEFRGYHNFLFSYHVWSLKPECHIFAFQEFKVPKVHLTVGDILDLKYKFLKGTNF